MELTIGKTKYVIRGALSEIVWLFLYPVFGVAGIFLVTLLVVSIPLWIISLLLLVKFGEKVEAGE